MSTFDWTKIPSAMISHQWIALLLLAWLLLIVLYIILQAWFSYAWAGRWRIAALAPLIGLAAAVIFFVFVHLKTPDAPPLEKSWDFAVFPVLGVISFSPFGFIFLVIVGIIHRVRGRQ